MTANNDEGECFALVDPGTPNVSDNCPGVTFKGVRDDGKALTDPYPVGTTTITWTATDAAGNQASCDQTITVEDAEKPKITCPDSIVANNDQGECFATVDPGTATATDNCDGVTVKGVRDDG
ncbi:MAG: HYR domain-containing protein, partial [Planctomycetota bacterium]|nr:HYR domain-containing protein [Planctomycetota bacterium]